MKNLFLIDGASGTGKTDLLEYIRDYGSRSHIVPKLTTRRQRPYEQEFQIELDLQFVTDEEFERLNPEYRYVYSGHKYGFSRLSLNAALASADNVFVIVRNRELILQLQSEYRFLNVVPVYIYSDGDKLAHRLKVQEGYNDEQVRFRMARNLTAFDDYLRHPGIYREIIINNSSQTDFKRLIDLMVEEHSPVPTVDPKLILVLMSFGKKNSALEDYYAGMKRAVASIDATLKCVRLDELSGTFRISDTARDFISRCRLAIVDLTENKQNVFYELGYIHGLRKTCILTSTSKNPKMFYTQEFKTIYYDNASDLENRLQHELKAVLPELC